MDDLIFHLFDHIVNAGKKVFAPLVFAGEHVDKLGEALVVWVAVMFGK